MIKLDDYRQVATRGVIDIIGRLAERAQGRRLLNVSGGRFGSGPAESLQRLVPLMSECLPETDRRGAGARWPRPG